MDFAALYDSDQGAAIVFLTAVVILLFLVVLQAMGLPARRARKGSRYPYRAPRLTIVEEPDLLDVGEQLKAVIAASFEKRKVLNRSEYRVFKIVEDFIIQLAKGHRVFAQTSLGEVLRSPSNHAFRSINSKRVDILVVDWKGHPVLAVEYSGSGHYLGTAAGRDAVKKEALRKAGVKYVEVSENDSDEKIRSQIQDSFAVEIAAE